MNKFWLVCFFPIIVSCGHKKSTCGDVKTGVFSYHGSRIERGDSVQSEILNDEVFVVVKKKIRWIDDCEYELTFISGHRMDTLPGGRLVVYEAKDKVQRIKIIETTQNYYVFEMYEGGGSYFRDTAWYWKNP
jgi:hypothetical protein